MSLADRLRADLAELAETMDPSVETALEAVLERAEGPQRRRFTSVSVLAAAAVLLLVLGTLVWWFAGRDHEPEVVVDPSPPSGTYEATLAGDLAGTWRIRFGGGSMSVVAPDNRALGTRVALAPYDVEGGVLTTSLLADGPCQGQGSYRWSGGDARLRFAVVDDDCDVRVRLMTSAAWSQPTGTVLPEGTYEAPRLTLDRLRKTAIAAGFSDRQVDRLLREFGDVTSVQYTLEVAGSWTEFESIDDDAPAIGWSGPYTVVDAGTVVAGEPPCGPITYDYRYDGRQVRFVVVDDECVEGGVTLPLGELFAQVTIYQSAPFTRVE